MIRLILILLTLTACDPLGYLHEYEGPPPYDEAAAIEVVLDTYAGNDLPHSIRVSDIRIGWLHMDFVPGRPEDIGVSTGCDDIWVTTRKSVNSAMSTLAHEIMHCYLERTGRGLDGDHSADQWELVETAHDNLQEYDLLNWDPPIYEHRY